MSRRHVACSLALALVLSGAAAGSAQAAEGKVRVAVLPFESASSDAEFESLGKGLQAMVTTDLLEAGVFELVERSRLADIQNELALTRTGAIDKTTAARIGKLAGATHLLMGTITVLGPRMRIDARMLKTQSGEIVLAEKIEGPKEEFFDLEKALVKKLVGVTGVELPPKVRVKVDRVHTADFNAFKTWSDGIDAFDRRDYRKSVELLERAAEIDPDFTLATLTMQEYEQEIAAMKTRVVTVEIDKRRAEEIAQNAEAAKEAKELEEFWAVAKGAGGDRIARLWALYNLHYRYGDSYDRIPNLHRIEDRFELERIADALATQYVAEAQSAFPRVHPMPDYYHHWSFLKEATDERDRRWEADYRKDVRKDWARSCRRLQLDDKACGDLMMKTAEKLRKLGADREDLASMVIKAGERYRAAGEVDAATIAFSAAQKISQDTYTLETLVGEVEANRNVKRLLASCNKGSPWLREYLVLEEWRRGYARNCDDDWSIQMTKEPLTLEAARMLTQMRTIPGRGPMLVSGHPVWIFGSRDMRTGPRTMRSSTDSIIYYEPEQRAYGVLSVIDGRKADEVEIGVELGYQPMRSWYPPQGYSPRRDQTEVEIVAGRPRVAIVFGLVDVDVAQREEAESGKEIVPRPMRGYGVLVDGKGVHLVEVTEDAGAREIKSTNHFDDLHLQWKRVGLKPLSSKGGGGRGGAVPVKVAVDGKKVRATVGKQSFDFELPKVRKGYYGIWIDGVGYAHYAKPTTK